MANLQLLRAGNTSESCSYCALYYSHFPDGKKVVYFLSKTVKEQCSPACVCNMSSCIMSLDEVSGHLSQYKQVLAPGLFSEPPLDLQCQQCRMLKSQLSHQPTPQVSGTCPSWYLCLETDSSLTLSKVLT